MGILKCMYMSGNTKKNKIMKTNKIIKIVMERDGMSFDDAMDLYQEALEEATELVNNTEEVGYDTYMEIEEIVQDYFGLEPDYVDVLLADMKLL